MTTTDAIWVMACINTVLIIVLLIVITRKPKPLSKPKLTKTELETVLDSSTKEVAGATDKALADLGERLSSQFTYLVDIHTKKVVSSFEASLAKATTAALAAYNQKLLNFQGEAERNFNAAQQKIAAYIEANEQEIKDLTTKRRQIATSKVEDELTQLIEAYLKQALVGGIDLNIQQDLIMKQLETLRPNLLEDLKDVGN